MLRNIDIDLVYQPLIDGPPGGHEALYKQACSGDGQTVEHWRKTWIGNFKAAKDKFGSFEEKTFGQLYGINRYKPAIVIGSGPSLKNAIPHLKENQEMDNPLLTISCLHNFGYFQDEGIKIDYYLSLDSGGVVIDDVSESRNNDGDFYWAQTKGQKLIAYIASDPKLWDLWQGEIYLFNSLIPDQSIRNEFDRVEVMRHYISSGGNALGACMYTAKAVMGSNPIIYVGGDFCFSYDMKFHSYDSRYDEAGHVINWVDVMSMPRRTWPSYFNFKCWFDRIACTVPGDYINCSEGIMGAYREGNIKQYRYMDLHAALYPYKCSDVVEEQERKQLPEGGFEVLGTQNLRLAELFKNTKYEKPITLF